MADFSLAGFARELGRLALAFETTVPTALAHAADLDARDAKRKIEHHQAAAARYPGWPRVIRRAVAEQRQFGYPRPGPPLFRPGVMRVSVECRAGAGTIESKVEIGSNEPVALRHERGMPTCNLPARSFLGRALAWKEREIVRLLGESAAAALGTREIR